VVGSALSVVGMGGLVLGVLAWQEGGESVGALPALGLVARGALVRWLVRRVREGKPALLDPHLFESRLFSFGISQGILQQIALGGMLIALPIFLQMVLGYNAMEAGLTLAPLSLTMFAVALIAGKRAGRRRPASIIRAGFAVLLVGLIALIPLVPRADTGWYLVIPLILAGAGLGLLVSQLNNYTLSPIAEDRIGEAAGINSATGSFGLSLADALEDDAQLMSNAQLEGVLEGQPADVSKEIVRINEDARPLTLQVALGVPLLAALVGLLCSFRMMRLRDPDPCAAADQMVAA
jgi:hypothetical protein